MIELHRDFVFGEYFCKQPDGTIVVLAMSDFADQDMVPVGEKCVRGYVYVTGWVVKAWAAAQGKTYSSVTYVAQADLKNLPQKILEMAGEEQPFIIHRLSQALQSGKRGPSLIIFEN